MALTKHDSRPTTLVKSHSISAPLKLKSQVDPRSQHPLVSFPHKKRAVPTNDSSKPGHFRQRTDSVSSVASTIVALRPRSRIQSIISSASRSLRRQSSEDAPSPKAVDARKSSSQMTNKSVVEFPKAITFQSSIPVWTQVAPSSNQRKRLLSRNDENEAQPRVRQRLHSATSIETIKNVPAPEANHSQEASSDLDLGQPRLDSLCRLPSSLGPKNSTVAKGASDSINMKPLISLKAKSSVQPVESKVNVRTRPPVTLSPSVLNISSSHLLNLDSVVDEILARDKVALTEHRDEQSTMHLNNLEDIPDLPLYLPPSLSQQNTVKSNLDRFDVKILSIRNTEVWDTVENGVYAWEGFLCVTDNMVTAIWANTPPVDSIFLECRTREPPTNSQLSSSASASSEYEFIYQGQTLYEEEVLHSMDYTKGITVNRKWERHYSYQEPNKVEWKLKFWVPIPMALFHKLEERLFRLRAKLTFRDPVACGMKIVAHSGSVDMSISSLKTAKFVRFA